MGSNHKAIEGLLKRLGYCPYCGGELTPATYDIRNEWLEWAPCGRELCPGEMVTIVTDTSGFIIFPKAKSRIFIYKRNYRSRSGNRRRT